jgi:uncharacterized protein YbjT (DUF2867 family)
MTENNRSKTVLLTGASGFIGSSLYPKLARKDNLRVLCATRRPESASEQYPDREWIQFDVHDTDSVKNAFRKSDAVYYLIHEMSSGAGYKEREKQAAITVRDQAERNDLERMIYLGGVAPEGEPSEHLKSRLKTGEILRTANCTVIELRAAMIIGAGSSSWQIVRDLAARLPIMLLPKWTQSRSQPVFIDDVVEALLGGLTLQIEQNEIFDLPGPRILTVEEILEETAELLQNQPINIRVPLLSPKLSSYWLKFVTRSDFYVARELVQGLRHDLLARNDRYWSLIDHTDLVDFKEATRRSIKKSSNNSFTSKLYENGIRGLNRLLS